MGEFKLIEKLKKTLGTPSRRVQTGIGDDTLVALPPNEKLLWTVDCLVEKVHFDFAYQRPHDVGWKALAVNLSDIAAMGGKALYALVSLGIPKRIKEATILGVYEGLKSCADWAKVDVVGGNITKTAQDFFIDVTVVGETRRPILRSGAQPGEGVAVTGCPGLSAAGLLALQKWGKKAFRNYPLSTLKHVHPEPWLDWAQTLADYKVTSLIDLSDGLSSELHHLADASHVGFEIEERLLPVCPEIRNLVNALKKNALSLTLHGGEEYELLMTFSLAQFGPLSVWAESQGVPFTLIGHTVSRSKGVKLRNRLGKLIPLQPLGWTHF
jgi:thiamine-monophosphate kinase